MSKTQRQAAYYAALLRERRAKREARKIDICNRVLSGETMRSIAASYDVSITAISATFKRYARQVRPDA